jgi:ribonuclease HII
MLYLLGTDEAGYGPNLGPLVVAATLWRVHDADLAAPPDLYERLSTGISSDPLDDARLTIADSKRLYTAWETLGRLERGVLAALELVERRAATWQTIWSVLSPGHLCNLPWHRTFDRPLPCACLPEELSQGLERFRLASQSGGVELVDVRAAILHPADFNDRCDRLASKGAVLSSATLALVRSMIAGRTEAPLHIVCDKHGGRNRYAAVVWEELAADEAAKSNGFPVQTICESRDESRYRWRCGAAQREICFVTKGERFLPAALASMTAKYLRELSMMAFNAFWAERVPHLRPTAGYPGDALRFWNDIEAMIRLTRLEERTLWRER